MTWIRFGNNHWIQTDHINEIFRHVHNKSTGEEHEEYALHMDNNSVIKLSSTEGDAVIAALGAVTDGPDDAKPNYGTDPQD